jgi:hypothetical protein
MIPTPLLPSHRYRLLSDQLSDYGVDVPYIQAHIRGLNSRSPLDLDGSASVLRDEEVAGSNPVTPTVISERNLIPEVELYRSLSIRVDLILHFSLLFIFE